MRSAPWPRPVSLHPRGDACMSGAQPLPMPPLRPEAASLSPPHATPAPTSSPPFDGDALFYWKPHWQGQGTAAQHLLVHASAVPLAAGRAPHLDIKVHHPLGYARLRRQVHLQLEPQPGVEVIPAVKHAVQMRMQCPRVTPGHPLHSVHELSGLRPDVNEALTSLSRSSAHPS